MTHTGKNYTPATFRALLRQAWPPAALVGAVLVNVLWIGVLGYALIRLL